MSGSNGDPGMEQARMTSITGLGTSAGLLSQQAFGVRQRQQHEAQDPMLGVAKTLGMSTDDLKSALQSGKSLNDVADEKNVSHEDLIAAIKTGMPTDRVNATDNADATQLAERIAGQSGTQGPPPGGPPKPAADATGQNTVSSSTLKAVSSLLKGQDSTDLQSVSSPKQLVDFLQQKGVDLNSLRNVLNSGSLLDVTA
jgi:hypothetical protein